MEISRQRRIHIKVDSDTESDEEPNNQNDILPVSNRNLISKIKSMQSVDFEKGKITIKNIPKEIKSDKKEIKLLGQSIIKQILEHGFVQLFILIVTTWAIFGDDIRLLTMSPTVDNFFSVVNWCIMCVFIIEYVMNVYIEPKYVYTVFSVLDILSIVSMVPMENLTDVVQNVVFFNADGGTVARTGRAAKVGAKAGRIIKATRFLRLGRLVMEAIDTKETHIESKRRNSTIKIDSVIKIEKQQSLDERPANCLSHRLSKELTVKVVIIIFLLLVVYPFLGVHVEPFQDRTTLLQNINDGCVQCSDQKFMDNLIAGILKQKELYYFNACGKTYKNYEKVTPKRHNWIKLYTTSYEKKELSLKTKQIFKTQLCKNIYGYQIHMNCIDVLLSKNIEPISNITAVFYEQKLYKTESLMSLYFLIFVLGLLVSSSFIISKDTDKISRLISDPLEKICKNMKSMQEFKFNENDSLPQKSEIHEINELTTSFTKLQNAIISFSRYVPIQVVKNLMKSNKEASINVERRVLSIFFSDIKGFTNICEALSPGQILSLLTQYFDAMEEIVSDTRGTIIEYVGDAILAVWNAPEEIDNHAEESIRCALQMQLKLAELRAKWLKEGFPEVYIRVGVNTSEVFHGNIGSHNRLKYGVLGDGVNLASRLEELNKRYGTELLVTNDTYENGRVSKLFLCRPVDIVVVKGKSIPTLLWEIVAEKKYASELVMNICDIQNKAMRAFLNQEFKEASNLYSEASMLEIQHKQKYKDMKLNYRFMYDTTTHINERTHLLIGSPKVANWDGSEKLDEKHF